MRKIKSQSTDAYKEVIADYFNLVLGSSKESNNYWKTDMKIYLLLKYHGPVFSVEEQADVDADLRKNMQSKVLLFTILQRQCGVRFKLSTQTKLIKDPTLFEQEKLFSISDVEKICVITKPVDIYQDLLTSLLSEELPMHSRQKGSMICFSPRRPSETDYSFHTSSVRGVRKAPLLPTNKERVQHLLSKEVQLSTWNELASDNTRSLSARIRSTSASFPPAQSIDFDSPSTSLSKEYNNPNTTFQANSTANMQNNKYTPTTSNTVENKKGLDGTNNPPNAMPSGSIKEFLMKRRENNCKILTNSKQREKSIAKYGSNRDAIDEQLNITSFLQSATSATVPEKNLQSELAKHHHNQPNVRNISSDPNLVRPKHMAMRGMSLDSKKANKNNVNNNNNKSIINKSTNKESHINNNQHNNNRELRDSSNSTSEIDILSVESGTNSSPEYSTTSSAESLGSPSLGRQSRPNHFLEKAIVAEKRKKEIFKRVSQDYRYFSLDQQLHKIIQEICGENSTEAIGGLLKMAEGLSQMGKAAASLHLLEEAHLRLVLRSFAPVELIVCYYTTSGRVFERMGEAHKAISYLKTALENLENVYGTGGMEGGLGHPMGLILCSKLASLCESTASFAESFRYCRKFEALWKIFAFPSSNPKLVTAVFGNSKLVSLEDENNIESSSAVYSWLTRTNMFDTRENPSDVFLSTKILNELDSDIDSNFLISRTTRDVAPYFKKTNPKIAGELWLCGTGRNGKYEGQRLVEQDTLQEEASVLLLPKKESFVSVACSLNNFIFLSETGNVYEISQISPHTKTNPKYSIITSVFNDCITEKITSVACTDGWNFVLTETGRVCCWGLNASVLTSNTRQARISRTLNLEAEKLVIKQDKTMKSNTREDTQTMKTKDAAHEQDVAKTLDISERIEIPDTTTIDLKTPSPSAAFLALQWKVLKIACGDHHVLFITDEGKVLSFGSGSEGALGHGIYTRDLCTPRIVQHLNPYFITDAAAGLQFSLVRTLDGHLFSFGRGSKGQLGHFFMQKIRKNYHEVSPKKIDSIAPRIHIKKIACGTDHAMALSETGDLYMWGSNESCKLGFPKNIDCVLTPEVLDKKFSSSPIVAISAARSHSAIVVSSGKLFTWGAYGWGQLGHGRRGREACPRLVTSFVVSENRVVNVATAFGITATITVPQTYRKKNFLKFATSEDNLRGHFSMVTEAAPNLRRVHSLMNCSTGDDLPNPPNEESSTPEQTAYRKSGLIKQTKKKLPTKQRNSYFPGLGETNNPTASLSDCATSGSSKKLKLPKIQKKHKHIDKSNKSKKPLK
eukprot:CAMPEP_0174258440 /NCGR_PEP_ID=MMETSP0439-20130205/7428_1 /TAXON_ID=0 /ORGANISM="Stereomyxa ramosa, Strain Chinc5" /LENGTH=1304 /DNA_ID=CAMNT_0015341945 /DNA_START=174 /DNA_END=4088 /DNA_ORIENTATION=-